MKCPLLIAAAITHDEKIEDSAVECGKKECAWWRDDIQMCAIKDLSLELGYTQHRLATIVEKMPHEY